MPQKRARRRAGAAKKPDRKKTAVPAAVDVGDDAGAVGLDVLLSINQAAHVFGRDRATITKRVATFGIEPSGTRRGHPVYSARELHEKLTQFEDDGTVNPDRMTPFERQAHYRAENEKNRVNLERGELMRREDVEREWARVLKLIALELDTIVDHVERDIGAAPLILARIEQQVDKIRERMYVGVLVAEERQATLESVGAAATA